MYRQPPPAPMKPPTSRLRIAAIAGAAIVGALLVIGYIAMTALDAKRTLTDVWSGEGGPPMTEEEVRAALAGPKKDFVGQWSSGLLGEGMLVIQADGRVGYALKRGSSHERANGSISSFTDDAFYVMTFRFEIEEPPRRVGSKWVMRVRGRSWERN
jgi:hypothetical protein